MNAKTFVLRTLGCKTNQYESQGIRERMRAAGYAETDDAAAAAVGIVNTCAVTGRADASCRHAVRQMRRDNPDLVVIVTGCAADLEQAWPSELGADLVLPNARKHRIAECLEHPESAGDASADDRFGLSISAFEGRTRAFVKIQDGCPGECAYCTVPAARGRPVSRPLPDILDEARRLIDRGHRELVFTGINIGAYRGDGGERLSHVAEAVAALPGLWRLRLGSVEPGFADDRLLAVMAASETICPHLHLPLQSGDDGVLRAMRRPYTRDDFRQLVDRIRARLDRPGITTDVIVGFPGEGEAAFANTQALCETVGFSRTHIFLYSPRPGTPAAERKSTETDRAIAERKQRLKSISDAAAETFAQSFVGETADVIVERPQDGFLTGYTDRYIPVRFVGDPKLEGERIALAVTGAEGATLTGEAREEEELP